MNRDRTVPGEGGPSPRKKRLTRDQVLTIPNALSLFRLVLIPVIVWLYVKKQNVPATLAVVALSGLTDVADGQIARRCNMVSDVGKVLDPIADKLTQAALLLCLLSRYRLLWVLVLLFIVKEALMAFWGFLTIRYADEVNSARWYGKASTVTLYAVMMILILFPRIAPAAANGLICLCAGMMMVSLVGYGRFYRGILNQPPEEGKDAPWAMTWKLVLVFVWLTVILVCFFFRDRFTVEGIVSLTPGNLFLAALVMIGLFALKSLSVVIYSGLLYVASGILFPLPVAVLVNFLGTAVMVTIPYLLGKRTGGSAVEQVVEKYPKAAQLHQFRARNDFMFVFLVRIIGRLPSDVVSMYMGAVGGAYRSYLPACLMGMLPHMITFPIMGGSITDLHSPVFWIALTAEIAYVAASVLLYRWYRKKHMEP